MTHALIIRFHYPKDDKRFDWRLAYFKAMVLPRILGQTYKNFDIAIWCNEWHEKIFESLSPRIKTFRTKIDPTKREDGHFKDFLPWSEVRGLQKYDIQSGLDSDDLISYDYIHTAHIEIDFWSRKHPGKSLLLSFQPRLFELKTLKAYELRVKYTREHSSAFFSIYQPDKENYKFAYEAGHWKDLPKLFDESIILPEGHCWATVHGLNESTTIKLKA